MNAILLVAAREFRQIAKTRGFRIMLLGLPLVLALSIAGTRYFGGNNGPNAYMIADASGMRIDTVIDRRIDADTHRSGDPAQFVRADIPASVVTDRGADAFGLSVAPLLKGNVKTSAGNR